MKRAALLLIFALFLFQTQFVHALVVVAPGANATVEGSISNFYPFGMDSTNPLNQNPLISQRYQQAYSASLFSGYNAPLTITRIAFRPDYQFPIAFITTLDYLQINMSTTPLALSSLTGNFNHNLGSDDTVVANGSRIISTGFSGPALGPKNFDIIIDLDTPFVYNPAAGNLILDVRNYSGQDSDPYNKLLFPPFDAEFSPEIWRAWTSNPDVDGVYSPNTPYFGFMGLVTQFTFEETAIIPAPAAILLALLGSGIVTIAHRRRVQ